jgi:NDP-sugar pyrophosphorylase family protein
VEVGGRPLLAIVAERLVAAGAERLVINVCHHADQIERWVAGRDLGCEVRISREEGGPFETGGGLWRARDLFTQRRPLVLHNVDVLSDVSLEAFVTAHEASGALVSLAVMERPTTRRLLFDDEGLLGRVDEGARLDVRARPARGVVRPLAFAGIHVASLALLGRLLERGRFPILDAYLRLVGEGACIAPWRVDGCRWIDVGRPADLERAQGLGLHVQAPPAHA